MCLPSDCGSYSEDIVKMVMEHTDKFYIRAERYAGLYEKVKQQTGWTTVEIGFQQYDVQSFPFESFLLTAMAANFYQYIVSLPLMCLFGVQYKLNIYSAKPYNIIWEHG